MKKYIGTLVAGMTLMAGFPLVGQAADKTTEATVTLEQDPENKDITLDEIPAVNFGTQKIINDSKTYDATTVTNDLKVTNPGNTDGWSVQVRGTKFMADQRELRGATLTFAKVDATADDTGNQSKATANEVTINESDQAIMAATANEGIGKFTSKYATDKVSLLIPAGNAAGAYKSTLTWTLGNAPS
ncbi:WxL domain-containing protein [Lactiplantibacillus paraplantarum]|uniref:Extracellular protein n=1 Tax=Lactiplantibacillus paraplantarum TaxID=60520 RepID=A0AAD0TQY5_9LACO|nr:WxL domain-containing protein [Lactiplantibacillus paraplantarum]AVW11568.1 WxL domain-containing protein [Lactiplantibacillus paraplantarum]AYJ39987.1 WxL domain-containing protein [Lactiplantibacillus paraplantarum]ERL43418.1 extracellular protein [Lactiplantibacillus paraplantarum]MCU4685055.1 WxL domain-containing protein [Lactiplantibacillus paraplantarum]MDL2062860.1 WxL domain-containing protein [Lactiplantibacillus paraplantarum]